MRHLSAPHNVIYRRIAVQTALAVVLAFSWFLRDSAAMASAFLGGLVIIVPSALFSWLYFFRFRDKTPAQVVWNLFSGEIVKLVMIVALVFLSVRYVPVDMLPFLTGLFIIQASVFFMPMSSPTRMRDDS